MRIDAVLFDLDCTLTDRRQSIAAAARLFAKTYPDCLAHCTPASLESAMWHADHWGYRDRREFFSECVEAIGWTTPPAMDELLRFWREDHPRCTVEAEGCTPLLASLRQAGVRTGIVTNGEVVSQQAKIEHLGLQRKVDAVVISGQLGIRKPDVRIFHHALERVDAVARRAIFVGDHPENDVAGAHGAGLYTVWIEGACRFPPDMPRPWQTIARLADLGPLLRSTIPGFSLYTQGAFLS